MKLSGVTIAHRALEHGYPVVESILSMLPICDEVVANVGTTPDGTAEAITAIGDPRIRLVREPWDESVREKGHLLSRETNRVLDAATGDWAVYLQADEVLHERDLAPLRGLIERVHADPGVDGVEFPYLHFYGSFGFVQDNPLGWYRSAVRAVRRGPEIRSVGDALKFRRVADGRERRLRSVRTTAVVHHYGWARHPERMVAKQRHLERYWRGDDEIGRRFADVTAADIYRDVRHLVPFRGSHPAVMAARVAAADWPFDPPRAAPRWARWPAEAVRRAWRRVAGGRAG